MNNLSFNTLRAANLMRCESPQGFNHLLRDWSIAEWTNAMAGEAGEACNVAKKMIRFRSGVKGNAPGKTREEYLADLVKEVANAVVYADLVLASEDVSLADAVRQVFNAKSDEIGSGIKL